MTVPMTEISFRGVRVFYQAWGQGDPLVLLHSGGSSSGQWQKVGEDLASRYRMIAPDFLGFGASSVWTEPGGLTHDLQADLVAEVIGREANAPTDIVGHSYGGATAIRLFMRRPDFVRSLVLIEPIVSWLLKDVGDPLFEQSVGLAHAFISSVRAGRAEEAWELFVDNSNGTGTWARLSDKTRVRLLAQSDQTVEGFISNLNNHTTIAECQRIEVPTTIVCGANTRAPDRRTTELLKDAILGSHYELIAGAGHMSPFTHPGDVSRIVVSHLARAAGRHP